MTDGLARFINDQKAALICEHESDIFVSVRRYEISTLPILARWVKN